MTASDEHSRRRMILGAISGTTVLIAGCVGDDTGADNDDNGGATTDDGGTDDDDDGDDETGSDQQMVDVPSELPTAPSESDYLDRSGTDVVEVVTRTGNDDEPEYVFDPPFVAVDPATTIRWINTDDAFHTVTSIPDLAERDGGGDVFDAEISTDGDEFEWEAVEPGVQHYYCLPHTGFMWGSIAILDDGSFPDIDVDEESADDEPVDDAEDDDIDDDEFTDVPAELPTDPTDEDFVDRTGESDVAVITRAGRDGEPNFVFDPPFVRVDEGTTVRWVNQDGVFHTITSTDSLESRSGGGDEFNATISAVGDEFELEMDEHGRQDYYCSPHAGFMFGSIEVE